MDKKDIGFVIVVLMFLGLGLFVASRGKTAELDPQLTQDIFEAKEYYVADAAMARQIIQCQGEMIRDRSENKGLSGIETKLENDYGILAVNLDGITAETAHQIEQACAFIFDEYPMLKGHVTNLAVRDEISQSDGTIAIYENYMYITNPDAESLYPFVVQNRILLTKRDFGNPDRLNNLITRNVRSGFWREGTTVSSIIVHELTHGLLDYMICASYGLCDSVYISEENGEAFARCSSEKLAQNQDYVRSLCEDAYRAYSDKAGTQISFDGFTELISGYAASKQEDGGISYEEIIAEAMTDYYINKDSCHPATQCILDQIKIRLDGDSNSFPAG